MKKSLLTLALVGLTASAYAADVYKSENVTATVGGELRVAGKFWQHSKDDDAQATDAAVVRKAGVAARTRLWFQVDAKASDSFQLGFFLRGSETPFNYAYENNKAKGADKFADPATKSETTTQFKPKFDLAYAYLAHDKFGKLTVGKTTTVAGDVFGGSTTLLDTKNFVTLLEKANLELVDAPSVDGSGSQVVRYDSLELGGFGLSYSYSNQTKVYADDHTQKKDKFGNPVFNYAQQALQLHYNVGKATFAVTAARQVQAFETKKEVVNNGQTTLDVVKIDYEPVVFVQASAQEKGTLVEGLNFGGAYTFTKQLDLWKSHTIEAEVGFDGFQYAQPYLGGSWNKLTKKEYEETIPAQNGAQATTKKYAPWAQSWVVYGGLNSDLFSYGSVKASAFLEGSYTQTTSSDGSEGAKTAALKGFGVAAGAKVRF